MSKSTKKRPVYNQVIIHSLLEKYDVDIDYIYKAIRGDRTSVKAIEIKSDYTRLDRVAKNAVYSALKSA